MDIERVNVGFMAVVAPRGEKVQIEFTYRTPGLIPGLAVTVFLVLLLAAYLAFARRRLPPDPAPANPGLLRRGSFSDYAKSRRAAFLRPGAMIPREFLPRTLEEEPESGAQNRRKRPAYRNSPGTGLTKSKSPVPRGASGTEGRSPAYHEKGTCFHGKSITCSLFCHSLL